MNYLNLHFSISVGCLLKNAKVKISFYASLLEISSVVERSPSTSINTQLDISCHNTASFRLLSPIQTKINSDFRNFLK